MIESLINYCPHSDISEAAGNPEQVPAPEKLTPLFGAITISGRSGTGKTKAAEMLAEIFKIDSSRNIKTGEKFRALKQQQSGQSIVGYYDRNLNLDEQLDAFQREVIQSADPKTPVILEGRLAGVIATEVGNQQDQEEQTRPPAPVVRILFTAKANVRYHRIFKREKEINPSLNFKDVISHTKEREKGDLNQWQKIHPALANSDPFNPSLTIGNQPVYDIVVPTDTMSVKEVVSFIINELKGMHLIQEPEEKGQAGHAVENVVFQS